MSFEKDEQQTLAVLIKRAEALTEIGRWREALKPLHQALVIAPDNSDVHCHIAHARYQLDDFEQALAHADRAIQSDPSNDWGYRLRSTVLLYVGRSAEALISAEEAVRIAPNCSYPLYTLAEAQIANQQLDDARRTALHARGLAPEDSRSHDVLAKVEMKNESWLEAEEHLRKALSFDPTASAVLNDLGVCLLKQKRVREAIEMFRRATRTDPSPENVRNNLKKSVKHLPGQVRIVGIVLIQLFISTIALGGSVKSLLASVILLHMLKKLIRDYTIDSLARFLITMPMVAAQSIITAVVGGASWILIIAAPFLSLTVFVILGMSFWGIPSLRSKEFKELSPDVQSFIRAEKRRERVYYFARVACGLSVSILIWWISIRILGPGPVFRGSSAEWVVFASLWACFIASAALFARRNSTYIKFLWDIFFGNEQKS